MRDKEPKDRLLPYLLDRLKDDRPDQPIEAPANRLFSLQTLRDSVRTDLESLLNTEKLDSLTNLTARPNVAKSVLNYGLGGFAGKTLSGTDPNKVAEAVRETLLKYEPRIMAESIVVRSKRKAATNAIVLEIEGDLWAEPAPEHLYLKTTIDLEDSTVEDFKKESR